MFTPYYSNLVAISSFRPKATGQVAANQLRAKKSWEQAFSQIYLFGPFEEQLACPKTEFIDCADFPSIASLVYVAASQEDPAVILNADIVVSHDLRNTLNRGWGMGAMALTSKRYEFDPAHPDYNQAKVVDPGADFFAAMPPAWAQVYKEIPPGFRIGHQLWDSYLLAFFNKRCVRRFWDMTNFRAVFHPKHADRHMPHPVVVPPECFYEQLGFPPTLV